MIRRWLFRGPAPAADRAATEAEARRDFLEALIEAKDDRIRELTARVAELEATSVEQARQLRIARTVAAVPQWMSEDSRNRTKRLDDMTTAVVSSEVVRRAAQRARRR